jgi:hypothetical protein
LDVRKFLPIQLHEGRQERARGSAKKADPQVPDLPTRSTPRHLRCFSRMMQDLLRFAKEDGSRCGKLNRSLRPVEELDAKLIFQVEDGLANGGLRHVQATRRLAVVQVMSDADEVTQVTKLHDFMLIAESDYYKQIIRFPRLPMPCETGAVNGMKP